MRFNSSFSRFKNVVKHYDKELIFSLSNSLINSFFGFFVYLIVIRNLDTLELEKYYFFSSVFLGINLIAASVNPVVIYFYSNKSINCSSTLSRSEPLNDYAINFTYWIVFLLVVTLSFCLLLYIIVFSGFNSLKFNSWELIIAFVSFSVFFYFSKRPAVLRGLNLISFEQKYLFLSGLLKNVVAIAALVFIKRALFFPLSVVSFILLLDQLSYRKLIDVKANINTGCKHNLATIDAAGAIFKRIASFFWGNFGSYLLSGLFVLIIIDSYKGQDKNSVLTYMQFVILITSFSASFFHRNQVNLMNSSFNGAALTVFKLFLQALSFYVFQVFCLYFIMPWFLPLLGKSSLVISNLNFLTLSLWGCINLILVGVSIFLSSQLKLFYNGLVLLAGSIFCGLAVLMIGMELAHLFLIQSIIILVIVLLPSILFIYKKFNFA